MATATSNLGAGSASTVDPQQAPANQSRDKTSSESSALPPFSFQKRPVKYSPNQAHSVISDIISHSQSGSTRRSAASLTSSTPKQDPKYHFYADVDYDEQIRAPRMTNINYYTHNKRNVSTVTTTSTDTSTNSSSDSVDPSLSEKDQKDQKDQQQQQQQQDQQQDQHHHHQYLPANFDLSQPTRRFSAPSPHAGADGEPSTTILSYAANNYMYERNSNPLAPPKAITNTSTASDDPQPPPAALSEHEKLQRALEILNNNTTSQERDASASHLNPRIKNRLVINQGHPCDVNGSNLKQVYDLKKPLIVPAVLRPTVSHETLSHHQPLTDTTKDDSMSVASSPVGLAVTPITTASNNDNNTNNQASGGESPTTPLVNVKAAFPFQFPFPRTNSATHPTSILSTTLTSTNQTPREPTHKHWKPDSFSNHCMKCFATFGNFFHPQRKRRHHCRFCGYIFCVDCLFKCHSEIFNLAQLTSGFKNTGSLSDDDVDVDEHAQNKLRAVRSSKSVNDLSANTATTNDYSGEDCYVSGVMMDEMARLVVPIFRNLSSVFDAADWGNYKICKICKDCGENYGALLHQLNSSRAAGDEAGAPFMFIENPYISKFEEDEMKKSQRSANIGESSIDAEAGILKNYGSSKDDNRHGSVGQVPNDWTWSSF